MYFYKQLTEGSWSDLYVNKTYSEIPQSELSYLERCVASNMVSPIVEGTNKLYKDIRGRTVDPAEYKTLCCR